MTLDDTFKAVAPLLPPTVLGTLLGLAYAISDDGQISDLKLAVTFFAAARFVIVHVVVATESHPVHDTNVAPVAGVAVSVRFEVFTKAALQVVPPPPQLSCVALSGTPGVEVDVTDPPPPPASVTDTVYGSRSNCAFTDRAAVIATVHVLVPVQAPVQPTNREYVFGVAVSVSDVL